MTNKRFNIIAQLSLIAILAAQFSCAALQKNELDRNRKLWDDSNIRNYKMTIQIQKTGHATPNGKFNITVRNGIAESIKIFDKPEIDMLKDSVIKFRRYDTIEGIFSFIKNAVDDKEKNNGSWSRRTIEYDAKFGYPKKVDLDQSGVFDDELYFEVLEFETAESSGGKTAEKPLLPKINSVPASEITKAEISVRDNDEPMSDSDGSYATSSAMSFSNDGTAFRSFKSLNFDTNKEQDLGDEKYQGVVSAEQFQKLAQTIADGDISNLKDSTERFSYAPNYVLTVTYAGKTKSIRTSNNGKNTAEVKAILQAFENLKNELDWKQIN